MKARPQGGQTKTQDSNLDVVNGVKPVGPGVWASIVCRTFHFYIMVKHSRGGASRQHFKLGEVSLILPSLSVTLSCGSMWGNFSSEGVILWVKADTLIL